MTGVELSFEPRRLLLGSPPMTNLAPSHSPLNEFSLKIYFFQTRRAWGGLGLFEHSKLVVETTVCVGGVYAVIASE